MSFQMTSHEAREIAAYDAEVDRHIQIIAEIHNVASPNVNAALRHYYSPVDKLTGAMAQLGLRRTVIHHVDILAELNALNPGEYGEKVGLSNMFLQDAARIAGTTVEAMEALVRDAS